MDESNDGGNAFPADPGWFEPDTVDVGQRIAGGMSLRDYMAAKAMQGLLAMEPAFHPENGAPSEPFHAGNDAHVRAVAKGAYRIADALLTAREN